MGGQAVEHAPSSKSVLGQPSYGSSQPATFHYSKGYGVEGRQWYGQDYLAPNNLEGMMWPSSGGPTGLQVPLTAPSGACASPSLTGLGPSGGSPILSSPPSSNASSSSSGQTYAPNYTLMVPPTVPSHSMGGEGSVSHTEGSASTEGARSYGGLAGHGYPTTYTDANAQLPAWSEPAHSTYVKSSPTPPPPAPHGGSSFSFDSWQQSTPSS